MFSFVVVVVFVFVFVNQLVWLMIK